MKRTRIHNESDSQSVEDQSISRPRTDSLPQAPSMPYPSHSRDLGLDSSLTDDEFAAKLGELRVIDESGTCTRQRFPRLQMVWNMPAGMKIITTFNDLFQPVDNEGGMYNRIIGSAARKMQLLPINYPDWHKVPKIDKEACWEVIQSKFVIPENGRDEIKCMAMKKLGERWKNWKCNLKATYYDETKTRAQIAAMAPNTVNRLQFADLVDFWFSDEGQRRSLRNKKNRECQKSTHTAGTKTFARHANDLKKKKGKAIDRGTLYVMLHRKKDGTAVDSIAAENIKKIEELMTQQPSNSEENVMESSASITWSPNDVYSQVMGPERRGRVRGIGFGPTPSMKNGSTSKTSEDYRMVVEESKKKDVKIEQLENRLDIMEQKFNLLFKMNPLLQIPQDVDEDSNAGEHSPQIRQRSSSASHEN